MTRRDFILLSTALRETLPAPNHDLYMRAQHRLDCHQIASAIAERHTGFDMERFLLDCGVTP